MPPVSLAADLDDPVSKHLRGTFVSLPERATTGEALTTLRGTQLPEQIVYFYVVAADGRLVGVLPTRRLLMAAPDARIGDLAVRKVVALPPHATVMDACTASSPCRWSTPSVD